MRHPILALLGGLALGFGMVGLLLTRAFVLWVIALGGACVMLKGIFGEEDET